MPLISVIIPCYNQGAFVDTAVDSVLASTFQDFEILIINDGSTDVATNAKLEKYSKEKTRVIFQENQGVSSAKNNGISQAQGKYILPLDADDKIHPNYLKQAVLAFESHSGLTLVYCMGEYFGAKTGLIEAREYDFATFLNTNLIFNSAIYKKSAWERAGGYKKEMDLALEDWEFYLTLIEQGAKVYRIPEVLFYYRKYKKSRSTDLEKDRFCTMQRKILQLHRDLYIDNIDLVYPFFYTISSAEIRKLRPSFLKRLLNLRVENSRLILYFLLIRIRLFKVKR